MEVMRSEHKQRMTALVKSIEFKVQQENNRVQDSFYDIHNSERAANLKEMQAFKDHILDEMTNLINAKFNNQEHNLEQHFLKFSSGTHWSQTKKLMVQNATIEHLKEQVRCSEKKGELIKPNSDHYNELKAEIAETKTIKEAFEIIYRDLP